MVYVAERFHLDTAAASSARLIQPSVGVGLVDGDVVQVPGPGWRHGHTGKRLLTDCAQGVSPVGCASSGTHGVEYASINGWRGWPPAVRAPRTMTSRA